MTIPRKMSMAPLDVIEEGGGVMGMGGGGGVLVKCVGRVRVREVQGLKWG